MHSHCCRNNDQTKDWLGVPGIHSVISLKVSSPRSVSLGQSQEPVLQALQENLAFAASRNYLHSGIDSDCGFVLSSTPPNRSSFPLPSLHLFLWPSCCSCGPCWPSQVYRISPPSWNLVHLKIPLSCKVTCSHAAA